MADEKKDVVEEPKKAPAKKAAAKPTAENQRETDTEREIEQVTLPKKTSEETRILLPHV